MTHLSSEELQAWFAHGRAADRERVIGHLAECDTCRKSLAVLATSVEPAPAAPAVTVAEALPRGYAARRPETTASWLGWLRPAYALAAAAVVVLAVLWVTTPGSVGPDDTVRSSELLSLAPTGATNSLEFRWASPFAAPRYRVVIRDAGGALVYSGETATSPLVVDAGSRGKFATMVEYSWTVSALDTSGEVIAESKPRGFLYQP